MIYMKILKKGGSREKGEEETKYMPHAPYLAYSRCDKKYVDLSK
jgi:hypothetical protein